MLSIKKLCANVGDKPILSDLNLQVGPGEVHAIMGPNGAGKSTLGNVLTGRGGYEVTAGQVLFQDLDLLALNPEERARSGIFLAFQYPVEIPGVSNMEFLKAAHDAHQQHQGQPLLSSVEFMKMARTTCAQVDMDPNFLKRGVNEGFSGGEKKRNEILQMMVLAPKLCILDETDSGLDIDALQAVSRGVNQMRAADRSFIVITHYQRLLDFIQPDFVHVLAKGRIVKSGDSNLAKELEATGYAWLDHEVA